MFRVRVVSVVSCAFYVREFPCLCTGDAATHSRHTHKARGVSLKPKGGDARRAFPGLGKASLIVQRRIEHNILIIGGSINKILKTYEDIRIKATDGCYNRNI